MLTRSRKEPVRKDSEDAAADVCEKATNTGIGALACKAKWSVMLVGTRPVASSSVPDRIFTVRGGGGLTRGREAATAFAT